LSKFSTYNEGYRNKFLQQYQFNKLKSLPDLYFPEVLRSATQDDILDVRFNMESHPGGSSRRKAQQDLFFKTHSMGPTLKREHLAFNEVVGLYDIWEDINDGNVTFTSGEYTFTSREKISCSPVGDEIKTRPVMIPET